MAASDNLIASSESWGFGFRSAFDDSWVSEAFARDTEILTKALHKSICNNDQINDDFLKTTSSQYQTQSFTSSGGNGGGGSETETISKRTTTFRNAGKITKRKSRSSKRSATTFITADPENFRQMVQQVTGIRFGGGPGLVGSVLKPEPQRVMNRVQIGCVLPTLDTSAFLLDHHEKQEDGVGLGSDFVGLGPGHGVGKIGGPGFDGFAGFPTLESWN